MPDQLILEPVINPNNRITFLLDWELTMKCNLDCSYCDTGINGGHDNSQKHPLLDKCVSAIDFMFEYVDIYMQQKPKGIKYVVLNIYGGEALYHPQIIDILKACKEKYLPYSTRWHLTVTTTTNAIVTEKKLNSIIEYVDEFTCSFHPEASEKQKNLFRENLQLIKKSGKRLKCVVLMHTDEQKFTESSSMIEWCKNNDIKFLAKQLDDDSFGQHVNYNNKQIKWFDNLHTSKSKIFQKFDSNTSRSCCGGREMCLGGNQKNKVQFVSNSFPDWYCSVNEFFLYIKQVNGEIYSNKDCRMDFHGSVGPIGNLDDAKKLIDYTRTHLEQHTLPVIQCKRIRCRCGLCAPKAKEKSDFIKIMEKYRS